jgi:hypothetical protein
MQVSVALTNACDLSCEFCYAPKVPATLPADRVDRWLAELDPVEEWVTALQDAQRIGFLRMAAGVEDGWHNAPTKQFVMVMSGMIEVEAADGEKRRFTPGTVLLVTDVAGRGNRTRVVGPEEVLLVWVPVP